MQTEGPHEHNSVAKRFPAIMYFNPATTMKVYLQPKQCSSHYNYKVTADSKDDFATINFQLCKYVRIRDGNQEKQASLRLHAVPIWLISCLRARGKKMTKNEQPQGLVHPAARTHLISFNHSFIIQDPAGYLSDKGNFISNEKTYCKQKPLESSNATISASKAHLSNVSASLYAFTTNQPIRARSPRNMTQLKKLDQENMRCRTNSAVKRMLDCHAWNL